MINNTPTESTKLWADPLMALFARAADRLHSRSEFEDIATHMTLPIHWLPRSGHMPMLDGSADQSISLILDWIDQTRSGNP